jgi:hypothetical protein
MSIAMIRRDGVHGARINHQKRNNQRELDVHGQFECRRQDVLFSQSYGAMYCGVPGRCVRVTYDTLNFAVSKALIRIRPVLSNKMFDGFKSQWMT